MHTREQTIFPSNFDLVLKICIEKMFKIAAFEKSVCGIIWGSTWINFLGKRIETERIWWAYKLEATLKKQIGDRPVQKKI